MILLDTCAAIWAATGDPTLAARARATIVDASATKTLYISAISAWEITTLVRRGRLVLSIPVQAFVDRLFYAPGVVECPVDRGVAAMAGSLAGEFPGDPADRMIVATAMIYGLRLITRDAGILSYAKHTHELMVAQC